MSINVLPMGIRGVSLDVHGYPWVSADDPWVLGDLEGGRGQQMDIRPFNDRWEFQG